MSALALATRHLLSTTTFDLPASALLFWLILRILRTGQSRLWLAVGVIAGLGLLDTDLVAFLMFSIVAGLLIAGPGPAARRSGHRGGCGVRRSQLSRISGSLRLAARLNNHLNVPDDEQGAPVWVCSDLRMSWAAAWPGLRYLG